MGKGGFGVASYALMLPDAASVKRLRHMKQIVLQYHRRNLTEFADADRLVVVKSTLV